MSDVIRNEQLSDEEEHINLVLHQNEEIQDGQDEYEEINSEEVDAIVASLERLSETVQSENIRYFLEEAATSIYFLVYSEEDQEDEYSEAA